MGSQTSIQEIVQEISAYKFSRENTAEQYDWLIGRCKILTQLLGQDGASPELINRINDITAYLVEQSREATHSLVRQQTLVFQQDAIVFHMIREGYARLITT